MSDTVVKESPGEEGRSMADLKQKRARGTVVTVYPAVFSLPLSRHINQALKCRSTPETY